MQDNQSGQDGLSLENFLRAVSSNPTDCLNRFSVSEWAAKYRGRREERENEGRNGYPFPLNVLSWPFLPFPQQGALIVICYLYIEISEEERSTHWHLSVKNGFVSPHLTSYFVIIATNRQEIIRNTILFVSRHKMIRATGLLIFLTTLQSVEGPLSG